MKQVIITLSLLYFCIAAVTDDELFKILPRDAINLSKIEPRYVKNYPVSRDPLNVYGGLYRRSIDHSLSFPIEAQVSHRDTNSLTTPVERRSDIRRTKSDGHQRTGSVSGIIPSALNRPLQEYRRQDSRERNSLSSSRASSRSPGRGRERSVLREGSKSSREPSQSSSRQSTISRDSAQDEAKVLIHKDGKDTLIRTAPYIDKNESIKSDVSRSPWKGLNSNKVTGYAYGRSSNEKLKLDVTGQKVAGEVKTHGESNAILRSHDPQRGTDTKMLIGGPRRSREFGGPKNQAIMEATSDDPNKQASISIETTGYAQARVRGTIDQKDDISFKSEAA